MKKFLLCLAVFLLASCIDVDDFSDYWSKGYIDHALLGTWDLDDAKSKDSMTWEIRDEKDGEYHIIGHSMTESMEAYQGKTLDAGKYKLLMIVMQKNGSGMLFRYEIKGDQFYLYSLRLKKTEELIAAQHLNQQSLRIVRKPPHCCADAWDRIAVTKFDSETYKFLSEVPDLPEYWEIGAIFLRHPQFKFNQ